MLCKKANKYDVTSDIFQFCYLDIVSTNANNLDIWFKYSIWYNVKNLKLYEKWNKTCRVQQWGLVYSIIINTMWATNPIITSRVIFNSKKKVLFYKIFVLKHIKNGYKFGHAHVRCLMCRYGATLSLNLSSAKNEEITVCSTWYKIHLEIPVIIFNKDSRSCDI